MTSTGSALAELRRHIDHERIVAGEEELAAASAVWNGSIAHRPALLVRCGTTADVVHAVRAAQESGLPLSVRGGGHDWAGRAIRTGGLVVDLTRMHDISIRDRVATVAGGARVADVAEAADHHGLTAVTGTVGSVGMAGLALGGGYGPLCGRLGLAADNILAAEVVLADGRVLHTRDDPDLLWALRGCGGNFGVVTSLDLALHPVSELRVGSFTFSHDDIGPVLVGLSETLDQAPDELNVVVTLVSNPQGEPVVTLTATWSGVAEDGRRHLDGLASLADPLTADTTTMSPLAKLRRFDGMFPDGAHYGIRTRTVAAFLPGVVSALIEAFAMRTVSGTFINIHHVNGMAARTPTDSAAFGVRQNHHMVELMESGQVGDPDLSDWPRTASRLLAPHSMPGGYPNLLGPDDIEQAGQAYGAHAARLRSIKDRVDPHGVFVATPLPPGG